MFHVGDRFRYRRLRHGKLARGLGHTAVLRDSKKGIQIAQFEAPADTRIDGHGCAPIKKSYMYILY